MSQITEEVSEPGLKLKAGLIQSQSSWPLYYKPPKLPKPRQQSSEDPHTFLCPKYCSVAPLTPASLYPGNFSPPTSDLGVRGRAVWGSFWDNSHSLKSLLWDVTLLVLPTTPSHGYPVPFYYQTSPTFPHPGQPHPETQGQNYDVSAHLHK